MTLQQIRYAIVIANTKSMNEAAKQLYITQPSLSASLKDLESELGITIFARSSKGVVVTTEGEEFLGYARQVIEQVALLEDKYTGNADIKKKFSISTQHYSFAVKAFVEMVKQFGMNEYEFAIKESKTYDIIQDVKYFKSELGILYLNDFNEKILQKLFKESDVEFHELFKCNAYVYMWKGNPLSSKSNLTLKDLEEYPCLSFEQGDNNSFYFSEEILSTYSYKKYIKASDRATMLNLMVGLNGYTLRSGIICEELNGSDYIAVPLDTDVMMRIGYITRKNTVVSSIGSKYIEELIQYADNVL